MQTQEKTNLDYFNDAARYNSGSHFLDSGGTNGRHWQNPAQPKDQPIVTVDECGATINTARFLSEHLEVDADLQAKFEAWAAEHEELSWFEAGEAFIQEFFPEMEQRARDNTYNSENDLSQVYVWEVYDEEGHSDWLFAEESTLTLVYIHTGADVRGGYSYPLFCRPKGEYSIPVDLCASYYAYESKGTDQDGGEISERWCNGYTSYPWGEVENDTARMFFFEGRQPDEFIASLKEGGTVKIQATAPECC